MKLALLLCVLLPPLSSVSAVTQPNVLLILADDLRDTVGCYGNAAVKTPNLRTQTASTSPVTTVSAISAAGQWAPP